jgi:hypothetical protein
MTQTLNELKLRSIENVREYHKSIKNMKNSNLTIFENLKRKVDNNPMSQGIAT